MLVVETAVGQALLARSREVGLTLDALAEKLAVPSTVLEELVRGEATLTPSLAEMLSDVLGSTPGEWLALDADDDDVDLVQAWEAALPDFKTETLRALRVRGEITATRAHPERLAAELAAFFGCRPDEVEDQVDASFRQSSAHHVHHDAVSTWLRLADRQASWLADLHGTPPLDEQRLRALLPDLVRVGGRKPADYLPEVRDQLREAGVVLVFQGDVKGSRLSGASWPTAAGYAVVALSLRYAFDDFFWWTVFHESSHLLLGHGRVLDSLAPEKSELEAAADRLAHELLLPDAWEASMKRPSKQKLRELGQALGVPAGLLVGQLQHAGRVAREDMNALKCQMPKAEDLEVRRRSRPSGAQWDTALARLVEEATRAS